MRENDRIQQRIGVKPDKGVCVCVDDPLISTSSANPPSDFLTRSQKNFHLFETEPFL